MSRIGNRLRALGNERHRSSLSFVSLGKRALEAALEVGMRGFVLFLSDVAATHERLGVQVSNRSLGFDEVVHERLRHRRVVALVVTTTAVAHEVDNDVAMELLPVRECELRDAHDGFWVIPVDVEDRGLNSLGNIR
jgi:hypothetical protein